MSLMDTSARQRARETLMRLEKVEDGTTALMDGDRVKAVYVDGCTFCDRMKAEGCAFFPMHDASHCCESGGHNHCTCDVCF